MHFRGTVEVTSKNSGDTTMGLGSGWRRAGWLRSLPMRAIACTAAVAAAVVGAAPAQGEMTGKAFTILVITDLSTVYSDTSGKGSVDAAKMAIADFGGSVNGVPIKLIVLDNKLDVGITVNKTRQLIETQGVNMITDVTGSAAAIEVAKLAKKYKVTTTFVSPGTTALTNDFCTKYAWHYAWDTYALANLAATKVTKLGAKRWYFITADYAFGHSLLEQFSRAAKAAGGTVVGNDMVPFPNDDFSSFLLKAQAAHADAIGILESGQDLRNAVKQAGEFGLMNGSVRLVPGQMNLTDVAALGISAWSGAILADPWYWNYDDRTREWSGRFRKLYGFAPGSLHAGNYSSVMQVLNTVKRIGSDDPDKIAAALEGSTFDDFFARNATFRKADHIVVHDMYLEQVKKANEVKTPDDVFTVLATVAGKDAFMPASESTCKHDWQ
jgi:branched-chain amino acid transport system substrate-binding protein